MNSKCPFCTQINLCAVNSKQCWCQKMHVTDDLLTLLPEQVINKACICKNCITDYQQDPVLFTEKYNGQAKQERSH